MSDRTYGPEEKAKLERLIKEGVTVLQEVEDLQAGLKDTVKSVAEELNVKPVLSIKQLKLLKIVTGVVIKTSTKISKLYLRLLVIIKMTNAYMHKDILGNLI